MKSQSGVMMSLGKGSIQSKLSKQKLNMQRSTESDIVGVDNHMAGVLCIIQLLDSQGYIIEYNSIFQDATIMENNGN